MKNNKFKTEPSGGVEKALTDERNAKATELTDERNEKATELTSERDLKMQQLIAERELKTKQLADKDKIIAAKDVIIADLTKEVERLNNKRFFKRYF
jgi:hypothetical protein